jgi:hypothetical protein
MAAKAHHPVEGTKTERQSFLCFPPIHFHSPYTPPQFPVRNVQFVIIFPFASRTRSCPGTAAQLLEHIVPAVLLEHEVALTFRLRRTEVVPLDFLSRLAEFLERLVDVILVDHDACLGAAGFGAELGAQTVEIEFAVLEVGVGLQLVPGWLLVFVATCEMWKKEWEGTYQMLLQLMSLPVLSFLVAVVCCGFCAMGFCCREAGRP